MERSKNGLWSTVFSALLAPIIRFLDKDSLPQYQGTLTIPGLRDRVEVLWESHGIPHVFAADERDLFRAQGYLHAQERLWQMDMNRRFLTGRIAAVFGNFSIPWRELSSQLRGRNSADFDYFMRLLGIRDAAVSSLELLPEEDRARLAAYSDGVNRYIERCGKKLPWEFRVLRYEPDPWKPQDCLTISKGFAFLLSPALFTRLNMIAIAAKLDGQTEKLRSLCPAYPDDAPTIARAVWDSVRGIWQFMNGTLAAGDWHPAGLGSNSWVVAPSRSATASAILCNDPHLRMTLPSIWYLMHLKAESSLARSDGYEVWGASIPGTPCIHLGQNRWIAWGVTAAICDDVELYRERIHPLEPARYLSGHKWRTMDHREEIIGVRGKKDISKIVRSTRHGPIISDFHATPEASEVLAFRWTAHDPSCEFRCLYGVNQSRNWDEFLASLAYQVAPTLNYVYADRRGNIGYSLAGKIPIRREVPSLLPLDGWLELNEWRGFVPFTELPRVYNPPEGMIAVANNQIVDASYPFYLSHFFEPPYRIRRITERLTAKQTLSPDDMAEAQMDTVSLHAKYLIGALKSDLGQFREENSKVRMAADRLLRWDADCHEHSVESAIFHVFHHRLMANLLIPALGEELFLAYVEIFNQCITPVDQILRNPDSPWFAARSRKEIVAKSLRETCAELEQMLGHPMEYWRWGRIHGLTLNHPLARLRLLRPALAIGPIPSPGDGTTINMGFYRRSAPFHHTVGASLRFIIDLGHWERSGFILPSGQSGHPLTTHYNDQPELWRFGRMIKMHLPENGTEEVDRLILEPTRSAPK
jgi:penicillin amidase